MICFCKKEIKKTHSFLDMEHFSCQRHVSYSLKDGKLHGFSINKNKKFLNQSKNNFTINNSRQEHPIETLIEFQQLINSL